jgi:hypothetical protein
MRHGSFTAIATYVALLVGAFGCTVTYGRAEDAYRSGRYLEAAENLARHEPEVGTMPPAQQARYGTFRGLALLRLGDYDGARRWMKFAYDAEQRQPTLQLDLRRQLDAGWSELERTNPK